MKGLLLKDFYMMRKYCKSYAFMVVLFIAVSFFGDGNLFFAFYPCMLCGMIPINLLAYDEQSHFLAYTGTLPYTKAQIVSEKYIMGIIVQGAVLILTAVAQAFKLGMSGSFSFREYAVIILTGAFASAVVAPLSLPFMFKFGTEKGRMVHLIMIGVICGGAYAASSLFENLQVSGGIDLAGFLPYICVICVAIYALSWYLSIVFYKRREI